eukprot:TRINITY_DN16293_c0_g1_i6.p1 TRINITY_DN16293_c0_g1~~TRINITY_DN16293_c0_g1_i6.p1  ORF type:complete len:390 (-),score=86.74 TRINITY_DN16293_c0_g1_i6:35-1204(-)
MCIRDRHYILGRTLRKRYIEDHKFLSEHYTPGQILVYATDAARTIESAQAQLVGLYGEGMGRFIEPQMIENAVPPNEHNYTKWQKKLGRSAVKYGYAEIPVYGVRDNIMVPSQLCRGISEMVRTYARENGERKKEKSKEFEAKGVYKEVAAAFGVEEEKVNLSNVLTLRDIVISSLWEGHPVKREEVSLRLKEITDPVDLFLSYEYFFKVQYEDRVVHKIIASGFLNKVKELIAEKVEAVRRNAESPLKFALFSGHDTMLNAIIMGLKINQGDILVPFASAVVLELYQREDKSFIVTVIFDRMVDFTYPLKDFYKLVSDNTYDPATAYRYCKSFKRNPKKEEKSTPITVYLIGAFCIASVLATAIIAIVYCVKRKRERTESMLENYCTL